MVKCVNCGYLAQHVYHGSIPQGFIAVEESSRETGSLPGLPFSISFHQLGEPDLTPEKMNGDRFPTCFCRASQLKQEIDTRYNEIKSSKGIGYADAVKDIINKEKPCKQFVDWERGFTPKEHREMMDRKRLLEQEEQRKKSDRTWHVIELAITLAVGAVIGLVAAYISRSR